MKKNIKIVSIVGIFLAVVGLVLEIVAYVLVKKGNQDTLGMLISGIVICVIGILLYGVPTIIYQVKAIKQEKVENQAKEIEEPVSQEPANGEQVDTEE